MEKESYESVEKVDVRDIRITHPLPKAAIHVVACMAAGAVTLSGALTNSTTKLQSINNSTTKLQSINSSGGATGAGGDGESASKPSGHVDVSHVNHVNESNKHDFHFLYGEHPTIW